MRTRFSEDYWYSRLRSLALLAGLGSMLLPTACTTIGQEYAMTCPSDSVIRVDDSMTWCELEGGTHVGTTLDWHTPGRLATASQLIDGRPASVVTFYTSGRIESIRVSGASESRETSFQWYPTGELRLRAEWRDEKLDGDYRMWHEDGSLKIGGTYDMGFRSGIWTVRETTESEARVVEYGESEGPKPLPASISQSDGSS